MKSKTAQSTEKYEKKLEDNGLMRARITVHKDEVKILRGFIRDAIDMEFLPLTKAVLEALKG